MSAREDRDGPITSTRSNEAEVYDPELAQDKSSRQAPEHAVREEGIAEPVFKLEVSPARSIRGVLRSHTAFAVAIGIIVLIEEIVKNVRGIEGCVVIENDDCKTVRFSDFDRDENITVAIFHTSTSLVLLSLLVVYVVRLHRNGWRNSKPEQVLTLLLCFATFLESIPVEAWSLAPVETAAEYFDIVIHGRRFSTFVSTAATQAILGFYVWAMCDVFAGRAKTWRGHCTSAFVMTIFLVLKAIIATEGMIGSHPFPFVGLVALTALVADVTFSDFQVALIVIICALEFGLLVWLFLVARTTKHELDRIDYAANRSRQLGFRFFAFSIGGLWTSGLIIGIFHESLSSNELRALLFQNLGYVALFDQGTVFDETALILLFVYAVSSQWRRSKVLTNSLRVLQVFATLPANTDKFPYWYRPIQRGVAPRKIDFVLREDDNDKAYATFSNLFVMETCVRALNFSWWAYRYNKDPDPRPTELNDYDEKIIHEEATDTHVLMYENSSRIIVAFRGTRGAKNVRTDLRTATIPFRTLRKRLEEGCESEGSPDVWEARVGDSREDPRSAELGMGNPDEPDLGACASIEDEAANLAGDRSIWRVRLDGCMSTLKVALRALIHPGEDADSSTTSLEDLVRLARVHSGFAKVTSAVYREVLQHVKKLYLQEKRPVIMCGHSLGGSMALLTAVNATMDFPELADNLSVYSFGAPRSGNGAYSTLAKKQIRYSWKVVMSNDLIPNVPLWPYRDSGTPVLLTPIGELFLDPTPLENISFNARRRKLDRHHVATYGAAFRRWGRSPRNHGYTPPIWPCYEEKMNKWHKEFVN